jgi:hypothetical protein
MHCTETDVLYFPFELNGNELFVFVNVFRVRNYIMGVISKKVKKSESLKLMLEAHSISAHSHMSLSNNVETVLI